MRSAAAAPPRCPWSHKLAGRRCSSTGDQDSGGATPLRPLLLFLRSRQLLRSRKPAMGAPSNPTWLRQRRPGQWGRACATSVAGPEGGASRPAKVRSGGAPLPGRAAPRRPAARPPNPHRGFRGPAGSPQSGLRPGGGRSSDGGAAQAPQLLPRLRPSPLCRARDDLRVHPGSVLRCPRDALRCFGGVAPLPGGSERWRLPGERATRPADVGPPRHSGTTRLYGQPPQRRQGQQRA
mmetsp:Transcript_13553/g.38573  ORF Transcript_13553/g.38573 Transcript_13553/m.38573 type:complete len:236 (-) Transcript_13553:1861-2568(-)